MTASTQNFAQQSRSRKDYKEYQLNQSSMTNGASSTEVENPQTSKEGVEQARSAVPDPDISVPEGVQLHNTCDTQEPPPVLAHHHDPTLVHSLLEQMSSYFNRSSKTIQYLEHNYANLRESYLDLEARYRTVKGEKISLSDQLDQVTKEKLGLLDRQSPISDESISKELTDVNAKILTFIRLEILKRPQQFASDNHILWNPDTYFPGSVFTLDQTLKEDRDARRDLLVNAIWKYFNETLFDRSKPFQSFGGLVAEELNLLYQRMYNNHDVDPEAAKWKAMTVQRMSAAELRDERLYRIRQLAVGFVERFTIAESKQREKEPEDPEDEKAELNVEGKEEKQIEAGTEEVASLRPSVRKQDELVDRLVDESSEFGQRFLNMANGAIGFARIVAGERAGFSLMMPDMRARAQPFWKPVNDEELDTSIITRAGTRAVDDHEGMVMYIVTPCLVKWGTGFGERLEEPSVLVKGYPRMAQVDADVD